MIHLLHCIDLRERKAASRTPAAIPTHKKGNAKGTRKEKDERWNTKQKGSPHHNTAALDRRLYVCSVLSLHTLILPRSLQRTFETSHPLALTGQHSALCSLPEREEKACLRE